MWSPKLPQWLMHGIPLRLVVLPVWGLCCPLRFFSTSSRLRLSTERSDWLRESWRPLPKRRWGKAGGEGRVGISNHGNVINGSYLGHNRDVSGHPEQHQPNLGLLWCSESWCAVNVCNAHFVFSCVIRIFIKAWIPPLAWLAEKHLQQLNDVSAPKNLKWLKHLKIKKSVRVM